MNLLRHDPTRRCIFCSGLLLVVCLLSLVCAAKAIAADVNSPTSSSAIRVACIGDSITFGAGVKDRDKNSYPVQLGKLLGPQYEVRNFGVSGATMLKKGDNPYWKQKAYQAAQSFKPNIVVIKLGTNDSKPQNWKFSAEFEGDVKAMAEELEKLDSKPRVFLCYPVPAFPGNWGINDETIKGQVIPAIEKVAKGKNLPIIDLYKALDGKKELFLDKVHPNADGARLIAEEVCKQIKQDTARK